MLTCAAYISQSIVEILLKNINKSYGEKKVIDNLSMKIASGSFTTLLGPSGCGKTTLLRMIAGLETPDSGEIFLGGRCVFSSEEEINIPPEKRGLGFVFQDFALWPHMKVKDNVAFGLKTQKKTENLDKKVMDALHAVQLDEFSERYPSQLSGGQQQRVSFARAIVTEPECILFDEPLSALDAMLREEMRSELKTLVTKRGITSIFVTHDQNEAMSLSDMIAVMSKGNIEQYDTPERIYSSPETVFSARFVGQSNWINENSMFRPEHAHMERQSEEELEFKAIVTAAEYLGSSYRLLLQHDGETWMIESEKKIKAGMEIPVYINRDSVIEIGKRVKK